MDSGRYPFLQYQSDFSYKINRIFPTKQKYVSALLDECRKDPNIRRVVVFGSALLARCNLWSDIDVYFECQSEPQRLPSIVSEKQAFDKFSNFTVSEAFRRTILQDGVVVYER